MLTDYMPYQTLTFAYPAKSKGEKERYTHLNAEFQTTARRDKKAFLRDFPGGTVAKTPHSQCRGPGFNPLSGN